MLPAYFSIARQFHNNFNRDFVEDNDIEEDWPKVHDLVHRIAALLREQLRRRVLPA